jgi:quercetin dioxygenase-like cupin family protein
VVEVAEGEVILRSGKLDVTLLVDIEQLAAVEVRAAPGWGKGSPHVHARHGEALYLFEGELALELEDGVRRLGPESWAFVPPQVVHAVEVTGDSPARFLVLHAPSSGYGDYVRGDVAAFDQRPAADSVSADPGLVVARRVGGSEGDNITDRPGKFTRTLKTSAGTEPVCIDSVPEGDYNVSVAVPDGYNATTSMNYALNVTAGDSSTLDFGAQQNSQAAPVAPSEGGRSPMLGILGGLLLVCGVGLGVYMRRAGH